MANKPEYIFTFTFKISRHKAEKLLDIIMGIFDLLGYEFGVDFVGGFSLNKK